jgi:hypothetical protein
VTRTIASIEVSEATLLEVAGILNEWGYEFAITRDKKTTPVLIDMHGLALAAFSKEQGYDFTMTEDLCGSTPTFLINAGSLRAKRFMTAHWPEGVFYYCGSSLVVRGRAILRSITTIQKAGLTIDLSKV